MPPLRRVSFRAGRSGDSVAAVARRYRVSAGQVASWNKCSAQARFKPGETVVVYVPNRPAKATRSASGAAKRTAAKAPPEKRTAAREPVRQGNDG